MALGGFLEWTPKIKAVENRWIRSLFETFAGNGFDLIETRYVELVKDLESKGEIDKEIYVLDKIGSNTRAEMALHYDLTVPTARYVTEFFSELLFPFKRQQIQKVWRGERPQFGRYREFYQADIDVIDIENLSLFYDAEVLVIGVKAMLGLGLRDFTVGISNRKIYEGYLASIGIEDREAALRVIDKLDKIGETAVIEILEQKQGIAHEIAVKCLVPSRMKFPLRDFSGQEILSALGTSGASLDAGVQELLSVVSSIKQMATPEILERIEVDLSFVRGFDYYTGTIFEGRFNFDSVYGSICSGGRYDNLTSGFTSQKLPGVGFSIGLTRILAYLHKKQYAFLESLIPQTATCCLILQDSQDNAPLHALSPAIAELGYAVKRIQVKDLKKGLEKANKFGAQITVFRRSEEILIKDLQSGAQQLLHTVGAEKPSQDGLRQAIDGLRQS